MSTDVAHVGPVQPKGQEQLKELIPSTQVPLFEHGFGAHSFTVSWQYSPAQPGRHEQVKDAPFDDWEHAPPCRHGEDEQDVGFTAEPHVSP